MEDDNIVQPSAAVMAAADEMEERIREAEAVAASISQHVMTTSPDKISDGISKVDTPKKGMTKPQLISHIMNIERNMKVQKPLLESYLQRKNKAELQEILDDKKNDATNVVRGTVIELKQETEAIKEARRENDQEHSTAAFRADAKMGAAFLFNINFAACKVAELASANFKVKESTGIDISGLSEETEQNKEQLLAILEQIYIENAGVISPYISPINQYVGLMLMLGANRAYKNSMRDEVKKELIAEQQKL